MEFDFPVTLVDSRLLKNIFDNKEKYHLSQAKLPIEEKIKLLVQLQKLTIEVRAQVKLKEQNYIWKI